jgi:hypothetical protein
VAAEAATISRIGSRLNENCGNVPLDTASRGKRPVDSPVIPNLRDRYGSAFATGRGIVCPSGP